MLPDTKIYSFKMAAKNNQVLSQRKRIGHRLIKLFSVRSSKNHLVIVTFCFQSIDATFNRFDLHYHTGKSSERIIIYTTIFIFSIIAEIMDINLCKSFVLSSFHYRTIEKAFNHLWQNRYNINTHNL